MTGAPGGPFGNLAPDPADFRKFFIFFLNFSLLIFLYSVLLILILSFLFFYWILGFGCLLYLRFA